MYKNRPLGPYRTLPELTANQHLIGDRYATRNGLLKRYRVEYRPNKHGAFSDSLTFHKRFERKLLAGFHEMFPQATSADTLAYRNYLRGYVGSWDYIHLFLLAESTIRLHKHFGDTLTAAEQAYMDVRASIVKHDDAILEKPEPGAYFDEEYRLNQQQARTLFDLMQADVKYAILAKIMITELAWAQQTHVDADDTKRDMHRFISGYLVPRMIHGPLAGPEAETWREFLADQIAGWWD